MRETDGPMTTEQKREAEFAALVTEKGTHRDAVEHWLAGLPKGVRAYKLSQVLGRQPVEPQGCVTWPSTRNRRGMNAGPRRCRKWIAPRVWIWIMYKGEVPPRQVVPMCGNPDCVAVQHCEATGMPRQRHFYDGGDA